MLKQFVTALPGTLTPVLLYMVLNVTLSVGEGKAKPLSSSWRFIGMLAGIAGAVVFAGLRSFAVISQQTAALRPALYVSVIADIAVTAAIAGSGWLINNWRSQCARQHSRQGDPIRCSRPREQRKRRFTWLDLANLVAPQLLRMHFSPAFRTSSSSWRTSWKQASRRSHPLCWHALWASSLA